MRSMLVVTAALVAGCSQDLATASRRWESARREISAVWPTQVVGRDVHFPGTHGG